MPIVAEDHADETHTRASKAPAKSEPPPPPANPCQDRGTSIYVLTSARRLYLCEEGREQHAYPVALGSGGLTKTAAGDRKTPIGEYSVKPPRQSPKWGTFIEIGYPTEAQRSVGYTGNEVGIHGPPRSVADLQRSMERKGAPATWDGVLSSTDWTDGCIATDTDAAVRAIARWVQRVRPSVIEIE